jgi:hypothetical protein
MNRMFGRVLAAPGGCFLDRRRGVCRRRHAAGATETDGPEREATRALEHGAPWGRRRGAEDFISGRFLAHYGWSPVMLCILWRLATDAHRADERSAAPVLTYLLATAVWQSTPRVAPSFSGRSEAFVEDPLQSG